MNPFDKKQKNKTKKPQPLNKKIGENLLSGKCLQYRGSETIYSNDSMLVKIYYKNIKHI